MHHALLVTMLALLAALPPASANQSRDPWMAAHMTGRGALSEGRYRDALEPLREALRLAEADTGNAERLAISLSDLAATLWHLGEHDQAEPLLRRTLAAQEAFSGADHPTLAPTLQYLGQLSLQQGRWQEAAERYERLVAIREADPESGAAVLAGNLATLGRIYFTLQRLSDAVAVLNRVVELRSVDGEPEPAVLASDLENLARVQLAVSALDDAETTLSRALELRRSGPVSGEQLHTLELIADLRHLQADLDGEVAVCHRMLAVATAGDEPDGELAALERLVDLFEARHPMPPLLRTVLPVFSELFEDRSDYGEYTLLCERLLEAHLRVWGNHDRRLHQDYRRLVWLYLAQGDTDTALERQLADHQLALQVLGPDAEETAVAMNNLGTVHFAAGRYDEALHCFRQALAIHEGNVHKSSSTLQVTLRNCIAAASQAGTKKEVREYEKRLRSLESADPPPAIRSLQTSQ